MAENENKQENVVVEDFKRTNAKKSKKKLWLMLRLLLMLRLYTKPTMLQQKTPIPTIVIMQPTKPKELLLIAFKK